MKMTGRDIGMLKIIIILLVLLIVLNKYNRAAFINLGIVLWNAVVNLFYDIYDRLTGK